MSQINADEKRSVVLSADGGLKAKFGATSEKQHISMCSAA